MYAATCRNWNDECELVDAQALPFTNLRGVDCTALDTATLLGLDVSEDQGEIDFIKVKADGASFVFIKATESSNIVDRRFRRNWSAAKSAGIVRGAFHLFHPYADVRAQIDNFVATVGSLCGGDLPPVLAINSHTNWARFSQRQCQEMVLAWLRGVEARLGIKPIIHIEGSTVDEYFGGPKAFSEYTLWLASHTPSLMPIVPSPWHTWTFWQFTGSGMINGINGYVALDRFAGSHRDLQKLQIVSARPLNSSVVQLSERIRPLRDQLGYRRSSFSSDSLFF